MPEQDFLHNRWRNRFGLIYVWLGGVGFILPTHTMPEIIARIVFIFLGLSLLISSFINSRRMGEVLIIMGFMALVTWVALAAGLLLIDVHNPLNKIYFWDIGLFLFLIVVHFDALGDIKSGK